MDTPDAASPRKDRIEPLWDRVDRNRWRLVGYVTLFWTVSSLWTAAAVWLVAATVWLVRISLGADPAMLASSLDPRFSLVGGCVASIAYVWWTLVRSDKAVRDRLHATLVAKGELYQTKMVVKDMAIAAGLPVAPALYLMQTSNVNAFVFNAIGRRPIIGITQGLADRLTLDEQRAVFANLVARIITRDVLVASAVAALIEPLQAWREHQLTKDDDNLEGLLGGATTRAQQRKEATFEVDGGALLLLPFGIAMVLLGEVIAANFRHSQLSAAEKADAEGMLLLKQPGAMLSALDKVVRFNNNVVAAGETFGPLFYCWTGDSTDDEDDPEWRRVARLREVLGAEGLLPRRAASDGDIDAAFAPPAPRLVDTGKE